MRLQATGLGRRVGERWLFRALDHVFEPGRLTVVVGRNGSGKSTLLRLLAGLDSADEGEVRMDDRPIVSFPPRERARALAYLPQQTALYHDLDVRELVSLGRGPHLGRFAFPNAHDHAAVDAALERVGLRSLADRPSSSLSGGERQRTMLARMLAGNTRVLVLDEPCTNLDIAHALAFLDLCRDLGHSGHTLVLAMHELELAARHADQLLCLGSDDRGGWLVGSPSEILVEGTIRTAFGVELDDRGLSFSLPRR